MGWIWLPPKEPGHACQGRRLVWEPPERANTLITLEVTGLRGGLKRNWLLFTDTIWTQPISSPFPVHSPARGAGAGLTPDPASSVPSLVPGWPVPWIPSSQRQRGEYCLRQGILTSPQCQPSAEPGNASLEPRGPCAARLAPREGDAAPEKAGAEAAGTHRVKASLETALWEQPSLRLSCRAGHRHAGTWHGRGPHRQGQESCGSEVIIHCTPVLGIVTHRTPGLAHQGEPPATPLPVAVLRPDLPGGRRHRSDPQREAGG